MKNRPVPVFYHVKSGSHCIFHSILLIRFALATITVFSYRNIVYFCLCVQFFLQIGLQVGKNIRKHIASYSTGSFFSTHNAKFLATKLSLSWNRAPNPPPPHIQIPFFLEYKPQFIFSYEVKLFRPTFELAYFR